MIEPFITLGTAALTGLVALMAIWLRWRLDRLDRMAEPTGNGFAKDMRDALKRIEATQTAQTADIAGLRADLGGIRSEIRHERDERTLLGRAVDALTRKAPE